MWLTNWLYRKQVTITGQTNFQTKLLGTDTIYSNNDLANYVKYNKFQCSATGTITHLRVYSAVSGNVKIALYSDNSGTPNSRLTYVGSTPVIGGQWNSIAVSHVSVSNGSYYWIVITGDTTGTSVNSYPTNIGTRLSKNEINYSDYTFPATYPGGYTPMNYTDSVSAYDATLTNFQTKLVIGESSGSGTCDFHVEGHSEIFPSVKNESGDLRFTSDDGETLLPFWVEKVEGTTPNRKATIWVKVSADLGTNQNIYCYYSNSSATNVSSGINTFIYFNEFDDLTDFTTIFGSPSVASSIVTISPRTEIRKTLTDTRPVTVDYNAKFSAVTTTGYWLGIAFGRYTDKDYNVAFLSHSSALYTSTYDGTAINTPITDFTGDYHIFSLKIASGANVNYLVDYASQGINTTHIDTAINDIWLVNHKSGSSGRTLYCDWVRTRKYASTEPSFNSSGSEQLFHNVITISSISHILQRKTETLNSISSIRLSEGSETISSISHIKLPPQYSNITSSSEIICHAKLATDIKYYNNKLYISCDTDPARLIVADITSGTPVSLGYDYDDSGEDLKNIKSITLDETRETVYASCNNGYILKIDINNPTTRESYYIGEIKQLYSISHKSDDLITYAADAEAGLSLFIWDEGTYSNINTDFRTRKTTTNVVNMIFLTKFAGLIKSDFRTKVSTNSKVNTDIRFALSYTSPVLPPPAPAPVPVISIIPLKQTDFHVYIDGTELGNTDLDLSSIKITHTVDEKSIANFTLYRKHDDIDNPTEISNHNTVQIKIGAAVNYEFTGKILDLDCSCNDEQINVTAECDSVPYSILSQSQTIANTLLPIYLVPSPIGYNGLYVQKVLRLRAGVQTELADSEYSFALPNAVTISYPISQPGDITTIYYYMATPYSINNVSLPLSSVNTPLSLYDVLLSNVKISNPYLVTTDPNPRYYNGTRIYLGTEVKERVVQYSAFPTSHVADLIEAGEFGFVPGYTYFWYVSVKLYTIFGQETFPTEVYIGTSLSPLSSNIFKIVDARYSIQKVLGAISTDLGYYTVGSAPFKDVSASKNGRYLPLPTWADKDDGKYLEMSAEYDFEQYNKDVCAIEYKKLLNINGDLFPKTSADINLTLDAYLYYRIALLSRINLTNTTSANIYNNDNGFPVSVKQIIIDSSTMQISLSCDNDKSQYELEILNGQYPVEPTTYIAYSYKVTSKYDLSSKEYI